MNYQNREGIWAKISAIRELVLSHAALIFLGIIASFLIFADLGGEHLWTDEGDTAVFALNILQYGVPSAWDGVTFTESDYGARLNEELVMVSHPWLQYYMTAASFLFFGQTAFGARFPFALCGLLTIPLLYGLIIRFTQDRRAALSASVLMVLCVQFLLLCRQSRNYAPHMLFGCLLVWQFFRLKDWRGCLWFVLTGVLLFHTTPAGFAPLGALGLLTLIYAPFAQYRRWYWRAFPLIMAGTVPWLFLASAGYEQNSNLLREWDRFGPRLVQFLIECASVTPVVGVVALFVWVWVRQYRQVAEGEKRKRSVVWLGRRVSRELFTDGERNLFVTAGAIIFGYAFLVAVTQSRQNMFNFGVRWVSLVIPLTMGMIGILIAKASRGNIKVWLAIMLVLGTTKFGRLSPWTFVDQERTVFDDSAPIALHVPTGWANKVFRTALVSFIRDLWHENPGAVAYTCDFLSKNALPGDIMLINYGWEPVYFHTRLPQSLKIMPNYPIYETARRHNLPEYVFSVKGTRWVVWRPIWDGYRDYNGEAILKRFEDAGAILIPVAVFPETMWENRENLHFRRFPGKDYKYPWRAEREKAGVHIFQVYWPSIDGTNNLPNIEFPPREENDANS